MPFSLTSYPTSECELTEWAILTGSRDQLVTALAHLYLRQEQNALRVINTLPTRLRARTRSVAPNVIAKLTAPKLSDLDTLRDGDEKQKKSAQYRIDTSIWHRDGLLFQHLSWIVALKSHPNGYMTSPHVRNADKGFDGFIIEFDEEHRIVERVVLCEDKATENPRSMITQSVWKEIRLILAGEREDEVEADLTTLLKAVPDLSPDEAEDAVDAIFWGNARQFRVSIATDDSHRRPNGFEHLLSGFENVAPGSARNRIGGVLAFNSVRQGLQELADEVIAKIQKIAAESEKGDV